MLSNWPIIFLAVHAPIAVMMSKSPGVATMHAVITITVGIVWALSKQRLDRVLYVAAYITGAEVLWRMCRAEIFWETGKYATALILAVALLHRGRNRSPAPALMYFICLLPSVIVAVFNAASFHVRQEISFNLSGPFSLFVCCWFFSELRISRAHIEKLLLALSGPIIGIAAIAMYGTYSTEYIKFTNESNFATSGGYGPNQVSSVLGLGVFALAMILLTAGRQGLFARLIYIGLVIVVGTQCALTFSRGGIYLALLASTATIVFLVGNMKSRGQGVLSILIVCIVTFTTVIPYLIEFTTGWISVRFTDIGSTNRFETMSADLQIWMDNPIFGVGVGQSTFHHIEYLGISMAAHTELSRLLAEHGIFGVVAILMLLYVIYKSTRTSVSNSGRALVIGMFTWSFCFMLVNGMRIVAPSFIFGLATAILLPEDETSFSE